LKFKPAAVALAALCLIATVSLLGWLGFAGNGQLAASKAVRNHASNQGSRDGSAIPNSATSENKKPAREDKPASDARILDGSQSEEVEDEEASDAAAEETSQDSAPTSAGINSTGVTGDRYAVQVGSFSTVSAANERVSSLRAAGFEARVAEAELAKRGTWYRVYSGRFESREEASRHESKLRASSAVVDTIITPVQE
jgi:cell division protein FtsN